MPEPCTSVPCDDYGKAVLRHLIGDPHKACTKWELSFIDYNTEGCIVVYASRRHNRGAFCELLENKLAAYVAPLVVHYDPKNRRDVADRLFTTTPWQPTSLIRELNRAKNVLIKFCPEQIEVHPAGHYTTSAHKKEAHRILQELVEALSAKDKLAAPMVSAKASYCQEGIGNCQEGIGKGKTKKALKKMRRLVRQKNAKQNAIAPN